MASSWRQIIGDDLTLESWKVGWKVGKMLTSNLSEGADEMMLTQMSITCHCDVHVTVIFAMKK